MFLVREAALQDIDELWDLIGHANSGMTTLQIDKDMLHDRLEKSVFAFSRTIEKPEGAPYVLVMEDCEAREIIGTSCIFSKTGGFEPFYAYKIESEKAICEALQMETLVHSLHLVKEHNGPTEIGSLFLRPDYRGKGCGKLLSLSRFLYMAAHPKRFATTTIAEMRGYQDELGVSPFWEAIGAHFFKVDFPRADSLSTINKKFIEDLMPRHPIYLELLPHDALQAIGQVHTQTKPALAMLESQGFRRNNLIDIFDGGPVVSCQTDQIKAIVETQQVAWRINDNPKNRVALLAQKNRPFRVVQTRVDVVHEDEVLIAEISQEAATILDLRSSDRVLILDVTS